MSRRFVSFVSILVVSIVLIGISVWLGWGGGEAKAALPNQLDAPQVDMPQVDAPTGYWIGLPVITPDVDNTQLLAGMLPEQAESYARQLLQQQAQPILMQLEELQMQGSVVNFSLQPDQHAIFVEVTPDEGSADKLADLNGTIFAIADDVPVCHTGAAAAFAEQVVGLSQAPDLSKATRLPQSATTTTPTIIVQYHSSSTWHYISGVADPSVTVNVRVLRNGREIVNRITTSWTDGGYYISPNWQSCPTSGYDLELQAGDVVEVTANGSTASTTVVDITASVDPDTNIVSGTTENGRSVEMNLGHRPDSFCSWASYSMTETAVGGAFSADFTSQVDFNRLASVSVYARDSNGNSTYASFTAHRIYAYFNSSAFGGVLPPNEVWNADLVRGATTIYTATGTTGSKGSYWSYFGDTIQDGDVIEVAGGGKTITYTATSLSNLSVDHNSDQSTGVIGASGAGRTVQGYFRNRTYGSLPTGCSYNASCATDTVDGSGNFTITSDFDMVRGDYLGDFYIFDSEGNYQAEYDYNNVPLIAGRVNSGYVRGYWSTRDTSINIVHRDSGGVIKNSATDYTDYYGYFTEYIGGNDIIAGDTVEVGNGVVTETMTVQDTTARLSSINDNVSGMAYNGQVIGMLNNYNRSNGYTYSWCAEGTASSNAYDLSWGTDVIGQSSVDVYNRGPDGHFTRLYAKSFSIDAAVGSTWLGGYAETLGTQVDITLKRGGTTISTTTTTASTYDGYYAASLGSNTITESDIIEVTTDDGNSASLSIPTLTANEDIGNNTIYGTSPAGDYVRVELRKNYNGGSWYYTLTDMADSSGNYAVPLNSLYWGRDCSALQAGHSCHQINLSYVNNEGHKVQKYGHYPASVSADSYEGDDTSATASPYVSIQSHSFHTSTDTDWVTFTVSADDIGKTYYLETNNMGWGMGTELRLYNTDATTFISSSWGYEPGKSSIMWIPSVAGVYYLQVSPPGIYYAAYCDAVYDLIITNQRVYLPIIATN